LRPPGPQIQRNQKRVTPNGLKQNPAGRPLKPPRVGAKEILAPLAIKAPNADLFTLMATLAALGARPARSRLHRSLAALSAAASAARVPVGAGRVWRDHWRPASARQRARRRWHPGSSNSAAAAIDRARLGAPGVGRRFRGRRCGRS